MALEGIQGNTLCADHYRPRAVVISTEGIFPVYMYMYLLKPWVNLYVYMYMQGYFRKHHKGNTDTFGGVIE